MHACEAHCLAWDATGDPAHLERAAAIAEAMCRRQAARCAHVSGSGTPLVYEHFTTDWAAPDIAFHRGGDGVRDRFRPWGFQPGHLLQWAKLLLWLDARERRSGSPPPAWRLATAWAFFDAAWKAAWDGGRACGGLVYGFGPAGGAEEEEAGATLVWSNEDKYAWVQASRGRETGEGGRCSRHSPTPSSQNEALAAAALLVSRLPAGSPERATARERYALVAAHSEACYIRAGPPPSPGPGLWLRALRPDCSAPLPGLEAFASESHYHVVGALLDAAGALEEAGAGEAAA